MSKIRVILSFLAVILLGECGVMKEALIPEVPELQGMRA